MKENKFLQTWKDLPSVWTHVVVYLFQSAMIILARWQKQALFIQLKQGYLLTWLMRSYDKAVLPSGFDPALWDSTSVWSELAIFMRSASNWEKELQEVRSQRTKMSEGVKENLKKKKKF